MHAFASLPVARVGSLRDGLPCVQQLHVTIFSVSGATPIDVLWSLSFDVMLARPPPWTSPYDVHTTGPIR